MTVSLQADAHKIRATLLKGHHDALLDIYHQHSRKLGNLLILRISEACQEKWPLSMTDYTPPPRGLSEGTVLKITVRSDLYPKLFQRYDLLPRIGRAAVFINMLNRHVELSRGAPDEVEGEMLKLDMPQSGQEPIAQGLVVAGGIEPVQPVTPPVGMDAVTEVPPQSHQHVQSYFNQEMVPTHQALDVSLTPPAPVIVETDPLDDLNTGL